MSNYENNGSYVRVEGADLVGKTTLLNGLQRYAQENHIDTVFIREPGQTRVGAQIRDLLLHSDEPDAIFTPEAETSLFTADRRITWDSVTEPALKLGKKVVSDRGYESTVCYQAAGGGIDPKQIIAITRAVMPERYMNPDSLVVLQVSPEERLRRYQIRMGQTGMSSDKIERRDLDYFMRVSEMYEIIARNPGAHIIDAEKSPEHVLQEALPLIFPR
jgi:dTMP kinase